MSKNTHVIKGNVRKDLESDKLLKMISERIYDRICSVSRFNVYSIDVLKVKNLSKNLIADYDKMTLYHRLLQPRRVLESQLIKHIKNKRKINRRSFDFLISRYELY